MNSKDILIVEDDQAIRRVIELELDYEEYSFDFATDGIEGLNRFENNEYKIVLLDLMLPKMNGLELCRKIRRQSSVYIIMLTAKRDISDKIVGLDIGADDYLTKPFEMEELLARIRSTIRRVNMNQVSQKRINVGPLLIDVLTREVSVLGQQIELSKTEYLLLEYLANNRGQVLTRDQILERVWGYDFEGETNILDVYIKYLRDKIDRPFHLKLIMTKRGVGYFLKG